MNQPPSATICILTYGDYLAYFRRCLESVLAHTPAGAFELRLGFNQADVSFHFALGRLCPDGVVPERQLLPGGVERFGWGGAESRRVRIWRSGVNLYKEPMARLLYHDVFLESEYAVWLDDDSFVEPGWWDGLAAVMAKRIDYIGQEWWVDYLPEQADMIRAQPWYVGVPFASRNGKAGAKFMTGGFMVVRAQRLREVSFPDVGCWQGDRLTQYGGDTLLGEIAQQQGWTRAIHHEHVKVNVDLEGKHPAPRRGGVGRQFGAAVDVVVR